MKVLEINKDNFEKEVLQSSKPVLLDLYADWCGPCKMAAPILEELAGEYEGKLVIGKLDVDKNQEVAGKFGVMSIPTVIMFEKGEEIDRQVGFAGKEGYEVMIKKVAK